MKNPEIYHTPLNLWFFSLANEAHGGQIQAYNNIV